MSSSGKVAGRISVRTYRHAFDFSVWVTDCEVVEEEHAVKGFSQELDLRLSCQLVLIRMLRTWLRTSIYPVISIANPT